MAQKKSGSDVYQFLKQSRKWQTTGAVIEGALTVNPSARLSELVKAGLVKKRPAKDGGVFRTEYRAA